MNLLPTPQRSPGGRSPDEILRARALALAREAPVEETAQSRLEVVEFCLGEEHYAIASAGVREVFPLKDLTPLPCTPAFVLGIVNVRGQVITVIDLRPLLDLPIAAQHESNKIIVLRAQDAQMALLAESLVGVRSVSIQSLHPAPPALSAARVHYLRGVTAERLIVLDAEQIISDPDLIVNEEVKAT